MSKYLIGIGDSFTQGQGSVSDETYIKYGREVYNSLHRLPIDNLERENSWVNVICRDYLDDYTAINLGEKGRGNRSAVKELYLNDIDPDAEKIVVFNLSGMERFDFAQKDANFNTHHFYSMFPNPWDKGEPHYQLWKTYAEYVYSEQFCVIETMLNLMEAQMWCQANNAKLVWLSAFDMRITKEHFIKNLPDKKRYLVDRIHWDKFLQPQGYRTMMHMLIAKQENDEKLAFDLAHGEYFEKYTKMHKAGRYITPCAHPSELGHQLFSEVLYHHLTDNNYV